MWLVMEVKSDAIKNNIAWEPGILGPWIKSSTLTVKAGSKPNAKRKFHQLNRVSEKHMDWLEEHPIQSLSF